jgi:phosphoribosylaminoimidazole (AIR) synthetase
MCNSCDDYKDAEVEGLYHMVVFSAGGIERDEMFSTFNMGVGMVLVIDPSNVDQVKELLPSAVVIGEVVEGSGVQIS